MGGAWPKGIGAITSFVEELAIAKQFYPGVFGLPLVHEDPESVAFKPDCTLVNRLKITAAPERIAPAVEFPNGPMDRPWGIRATSFRDPAGHIHEIANQPGGHSVEARSQRLTIARVVP